MQNGAVWFRLVHLGADYCNLGNLVKIGATWCRLVQFGASWGNLVQLGVDWFYLVENGRSWCNLVQIGESWCRSRESLSVRKYAKCHMKNDVYC